MGMGEYAAHWRFSNNSFVLHPGPNTAVALAIGGFDIDFSHIATPVTDGSTITGKTISSPASSVDIFVASPRSPNAGAHVISNNTIRGFATPISIDPAKHPGSIVSSN